MKHVVCSIIILIVFLGLFFGNISLVSAETTILDPAGNPIETSPQNGFVSYLNNLFKFAIIFSALIAVIIITIAGFQYILAGGNVGVVEKAKNDITQAILGLLLVLASYLILYTINPDLVTTGLNITPLTIKKTEAPPPSVPVACSKPPEFSCPKNSKLGSASECISMSCEATINNVTTQVPCCVGY